MDVKSIAHCISIDSLNTVLDILEQRICELNRPKEQLPYYYSRNSLDELFIAQCEIARLKREYERKNQ